MSLFGLGLSGGETALVAWGPSGTQIYTKGALQNPLKQRVLPTDHPELLQPVDLARGRAHYCAARDVCA